MKIISKFKDYYDYLQGVYGVDPKKVLDRRTGQANPFLFEGFQLFFCGTIYRRLDRAYYNKRVKEECRTWRPMYPKVEEPIYVGKEGFDGIYIDDECVWFKLNEPKLKFEIPYGIIDNSYEFITVPYPKLEDLGFNKIMPPQECYLAIEAYISYKEPDVPSDPTDTQRFEGKGFDKKISFRK